MERDFAAGDPDTWTFSCWFKGGPWTTGYPKILQGADPAVAADNADTSLQFDVNDKLTFVNWNSGYDGQRITTQSVLDVGAWYHIVFVYDSGNGTPADRIKMYLNGVQITSFGTEVNPTVDEDSNFNKSSPQCTMHLGSHFGRDIGSRWRGYMAEVAYVDGTVYAASDFGEFNTDSPTIWQPKDFAGDITFGTNGLYLDFADSANLGADVSGNGNDLTESGFTAADQGTDTPTNNFCTLNPLDNFYASSTFSEGNCKITTDSSAYAYNTGTVGLSAGLWYWEMKDVAAAGSGDEVTGIAAAPTTSTTDWVGKTSETFAYYGNTGQSYTNDVASSYGDTWADSDIIGVYLDLTANKLYFAKNGTVQNSGTGISITAAASTATGLYFPAASDYHSAGSGIYAFNFGGCSAFDVTSANQDANGYGNFEYSPSDGGSASFDGSAKDFLAICTKNLGSDGG